MFVEDFFFVLLYQNTCRRWSDVRSTRRRTVTCRSSTACSSRTSPASPGQTSRLGGLLVVFWGHIHKAHKGTTEVKGKN